MQGDCFVECFVRNDVQNRRESFVLHDGHFVFSCGDAGPHVAAAGVLRSVERLAAVENLAALFLDFHDGLLHCFDGAGVNQRPHQCALFERIADRDLLVRSDQLLDQRVALRVVYDDAAGAGAALSGGADGAEENGTVDHFHVGVRGDDDGIVAAEFKDGSPEALADDLADVMAHRATAGGGHQRDAAVVDQSLPD